MESPVVPPRGEEGKQSVAGVRGVSDDAALPPWTLPVFRVRVEEVWLSNLTNRGLLVWKSRIQLQMEVLMPRSLGR